MDFLFITGEVAGMNTLQRSIAIVGIALVGLGFFLLVKYKRKGKLISLILCTIIKEYHT